MDGGAAFSCLPKNMKIVLLNGTESNSAMATRLEEEIIQFHYSQNGLIKTFHLAELEIPSCKGEFNCWLQNPGECTHPGPHQEIVREIIQSDLAIALTPVAFGGYSSLFKKAWDHIVPLGHPYLTRYQGETHHKLRYSRYPSFLAIGLMDRPDAEAEKIFHTLVRRNALNLHSSSYDSRIVFSDQAELAIQSLSEWAKLRYSSHDQNLTSIDLELSPTVSTFPPPRRALLLCGSPHGWKGSSAAIGQYLRERLREKEILAESIWLHKSLQSDTEWEKLCRAYESSDLVLLTAPLYIDSLPASVIEVLERLHKKYAYHASAQRRALAALVNSGFPEAKHNLTALAIYRQFARKSGLDWVGGLAIGGGAMVNGQKLQDLGGRAQYIMRALDAASAALVQGKPIPPEAQKHAGKMPFPAFVYRLFANWGFRQEVKRRGILSKIGAQPYASLELGCNQK